MLASIACSPSGILAALVPGGDGRLTSVATASTWPWEFDVYEWLRCAEAGGNGQPDAGGAAACYPDTDIRSRNPSHELYTCASRAAPAVCHHEALCDRLAMRAID